MKNPGLGGVGASSDLSENEQKKFLLMYHDEQFQRDPVFLFAAFSHFQIKACSTGGFIMADSGKVDQISDCFLSLEQSTLQNILERMENGEVVKPSINEETNCFHVLSDLDHIAGKVNGSVTAKKHQRNEIWSLMAYLGCPVWYVTISPAGSKNPICLYFASSKTKFEVKMRNCNEHLILVSCHMCQIF